MATENTSKPDPKNYVASVEKALRLLELFTDESPELRLSEIVKRGGYSRTATYRLLSTLEHLDWVVRKDDNYQLSLRVFRVGSSAMNALQMRQEASQSLVELAARVGETVYLLVPDADRAVCLERIEGNSQVKIMVLDVGRSLPIYAGGGSLAILSYRDDLLAALGKRKSFPLPNGDELPRESLEKICRETRERGYSRSIEDVTPAIGAFGAPIRNNRGTVIAAISIGGLSQTLRANEAEFAKELVSAAEEVSNRMGFVIPR